MILTANQRMLVVAGAVLFLIGLLQGAVVQSFANPRMALSAHLTAVQSGMAMMIVGALLSAARLSERPAGIARWTIIAGMYLLWFGLTASAATGASESLPIAGAGYNADAMMEWLVSATIMLGSVLMIVGWTIFVVGLVRRGR
ncbi:hydrogenase [Altererythrobacter aurantiacus]|uniref:Hydrogenase n=1 Tax=Parapontixanthobacter aurantiacus TaxID=1463599 RepID=A0A844ZBP5_9SPHN|nr:hydrogenase [Parapontixanthobacter aurantiacus]MXO84934.1 hydrogenase [Parapontixanthobacter aurantiacus]